MPTPGQKTLLLKPTYTQRILATNPIGYWPLDDRAGTTVRDATLYARNGVCKSATEPVLGQVGIGDGRAAPSFDSFNDYIDLYSSSLQTAFNGAEGTIALWFRVIGVGVWTDATLRRIIRFAVDSQNLVTIAKLTTDNTVQFQYVSGNVSKGRTKSSVSTVDWTHVAMTWSKSADEVKCWYNGVQEQTTSNTISTFVGSLASTSVVLGSTSTTPAAPWSGYIAHAAVWDRPLTPMVLAGLAGRS